MKKAGIAAIVLGGILVSVGILGIIVLAGSGVSSEELALALGLANMAGMTSSLSPGERFLLWLVQGRIAFLILGLLLIAGGITALVVNRSRAHTRPQSKPAPLAASNTVKKAGSAARSRTYDAYDDEREETVPKQVRKQYAPRSQPRKEAAGSDPDRCCICARPLAGGYAVLCKLTNGKEARIDKVCFQAVHVMADSEDVSELRRAVASMKPYLDHIDIAVSRRLEEFIDSAEDFIGGSY